ncbi:MAG: DUF1722 domain-containing protein, partial [Candidatus Electrothrix sp. MAN1_4]|nr:DUF1722 domain-containing protein [Candidatus Electrothrix sp. MAN1_4]
MRIWDINPGYLNNQSLLGEHRELHGIVSIIVNNKKGYSRHPETLRWVGYEWALKMRHELLSAEMALRGFNEQSPVAIDSNGHIWPEKYINPPQEQFFLLAEKYREKEKGRIPLPKNSQQLWSQHKYSVMARNIPLYKSIGREVARDAQPASSEDFSRLALQLTQLLQTAPVAGGIRNALQHMWGYVTDFIPGKATSEKSIDIWPLDKLLHSI